jgi:hypothetical protein
MMDAGTYWQVNLLFVYKTILLLGFVFFSKVKGP